MIYKTVELRFYGALVDFIEGRRPTIQRTFDVAPDIKDLIEACGVPHPEVDLVLVNGDPVSWDHRLSDGELISVFPRFRNFDVAAISPVHVEPLPEPRFVLDVHLGKLARYLRLVGSDAVQPPGADDDLAALSVGEGRALLTRDLGLLKRSTIRHGYFVRAVEPLLQCAEVVAHFDLVPAPFTRCLVCNGAIAPVQRDEVEHRVPPGVSKRVGEFRQCTGCHRVYWEGTHSERLRRVVGAIELMAGR